MRLSKAWLVATRDFKVFSKQKNIWYPLVAFPLIISVIFPIVLNFAQTRNTEITVITLTGLMNSFSFFFHNRSRIYSPKYCFIQYSW